MPADTTPTPTDEPSKSRWSSWSTFAKALALILLADLVSFGLVFVVLVSYQQDQNKKDSQRTTDQFYLSCLNSKNTRAGNRAMVHIAYDSQGKPLDLTHIDGYAALDPATKAWVVNIAKATASAPTATAQRDEILALFADRNCEKEYPDHTKGLHLPDSAPTLSSTTTTTTTTSTP